MTQDDFCYHSRLLTERNIIPLNVKDDLDNIYCCLSFQAHKYKMLTPENISFDYPDSTWRQRQKSGRN